MRIGTNPVMRVLALAVIVVACAAATTMPVSAQTVICADEPLLGTFDANGDGILMVGEVRQAAPDDERIQSVADQMEAAGLDGIQYRGCDPESDDSGNAGSDGDDNAGSSDDNAGSSDGGSTGDQEQATDNASGAADASTSEEADETPDAEPTAVATPEPDTSGETGWFDERLTVTTLPGVGDGPQQGSSGAGVVVLGTTLLLTVIATALWRTARSQARR